MRQDLEKIIEEIIKKISTTEFIDYSTLIESIDMELEHKGFTKNQSKELKILIYSRITKES